MVLQMDFLEYEFELVGKACTWHHAIVPSLHKERAILSTPLASFPGFLTVQFLIACILQAIKLDGGKDWERGYWSGHNRATWQAIVLPSCGLSTEHETTRAVEQLKVVVQLKWRRMIY